MRILCVILLFIYANICVGQKIPPKKCVIFPAFNIVDTNSECKFIAYSCNIYSIDWFNYLRSKGKIDTLVLGNGKWCFSSPANSHSAKINTKTLILASPTFQYSKNINLGGYTNLISYFNCDEIIYGRLLKPKSSDTLDFGNAIKAFIRSSQLPIVKKMKVIRHYELDTILTNDSTNYYINFHGRRVFLKTHLGFIPYRK